MCRFCDGESNDTMFCVCSVFNTWHRNDYVSLTARYKRNTKWFSVQEGTVHSLGMLLNFRKPASMVHAILYGEPFCIPVAKHGF